jgi:high-affinity iron transporter
MILTHLGLLGLLASTQVAVPAADTLLTDPAPVARRVASMVLLAAQEYDIGVENRRIVLAPEVEEARLFLSEARKATARLPADEGGRIAASIDTLLLLIQRTADPADVSSLARSATAGMAARLGISLEEIPAATPLAARGAEIYRSTCASCHGDRGAGDGPAAPGLDPPPANLSDREALADASPQDFYRRITIGVAGTAMPGYETILSADDRWAAALYATLLRLPPPSGEIPDSLRDFAKTAKLSDIALLASLGGEGDAVLARLSAVRNAGTGGPDAAQAARVFEQVRSGIDSTIALAAAGQQDGAQSMALDAYITFEQVERTLRIRNPGLAADLESGFGELRARAGDGEASLTEIEASLLAGLERAERAFADRPSTVGLFLQSAVLMLREGLEAILVVGALLTFLVKTGAGERRRDIHIGVILALAASAVTAVLIETVFHLSARHQETLEGITMLVAVVVLFYVSYWLLSRMEVVKWTSYVKSRVHMAVTTGSTFALASAAFLAVYREGFETILFYKALVVSGGSAGLPPILIGLVVGAVLLAVVYFALNRFGVRLPLRPFFAVTSTFLYFMAFIFAGKGVAELQAGRVVGTTFVGWAPRASALGIYPTLETMLAQSVLVLLALVALAWVFLVEPRRLRVTSQLAPGAIEAPRPAGRQPAEPDASRDLIRSLERIETDIAEIKSEVERMRETIADRAHTQALNDEP